MPLLELIDVDVRYGPIIGTRGVSFSLDAGETLALVGSNGAGKSSTLKAILGIAEYPEGDIVVDGQSLKGMQAPQIVRYGIGYSPEGRRVFPQLSVQDNLKMGGYVIDKGELEARMQQVYGYFPVLAERSRQMAQNLSGGEQQMLALARGLMCKPRIFLLDEPSLGLAPVIVDRIGELIEEITRAEGIAIILAEQNANWALRQAQRGIILELGKVVLTGTSSELLENPDVQNAYLGT
jgi:branched-chain amino acid transport system ATP-binding protein